MKRTTLLLFCFAFATAVLGDESFTLNIPPRFNAQQEIGEVRILLTVSAATAGAQLLVNGTSTINLGSTSTVAGDSVTFEAAAGNAVRIVYRPLSNFTGNFCAGNVTMEKNIPLRFIGAQDIVSYRMSTYIVGAPSRNARKYRSGRTTSRPRFCRPVTASHPISTRSTKAGCSSTWWSCSTSPAAWPACRRARSRDRRKRRSSAPPRPRSSRSGVRSTRTRKASTSRRTASASSSSTPSPPRNRSPAAIRRKLFRAARDRRPGPGHQWNAVESNINTLTPGSATSVGGGINSAMSQWVADADNDLYLLVVTDGIQNTAPLLAPTPAGFLGLDPVSGLDPELRKRFIPIQSIGFGIAVRRRCRSPDRIALETSGVNFISVDAMTAFASFGQSLVAILKGNTASLAMQRQESLTGAGPARRGR